MAREHTLEMEMADLGRNRFWKELEEAKQRGAETKTPGARHVMRIAIEPVARAVEAFLAKKVSGEPGKARAYLKLLKPEEAAFITAKVILDGVSSNHFILKTALAIADAIEEAVRGQSCGKLHQDSIEWMPWPKNDKVHLGQNCISFFTDATGLAQRVTQQRGKNKTISFLEPTAACLALITERNKRCELLSPTFMPTVAPPRPWTAPHSGGYWFLLRPQPFIKNASKKQLSELADTPAMASVYEAINAMQETAWKINKPVLAVMQTVGEQKLPLGGFGFQTSQALPPCPSCNGAVDSTRRDHTCFDADKAAHRIWSRAAAKVHAANQKSRSKQLQAAKGLWVADKFKDDAAIFFPTNLDFRGRAYALPMFLNPQGADWAKGVLTFAHGKPITDERAARWLMIHGANTWGEDKVTLDRRIGWVEENRARILACAADPLSETMWSDADKPW